MKQRITLIGPGAIGGTVAAWLSQDTALDVTVCVRTVLARLRVETPQGVIEATPRVLTDPSESHPADWVLIATKVYDLESTAAWLPGLMHDRTRVAVLQNGVEHVARFAPFVDESVITPVIVDLPAERTAPGVIHQRRMGSLLVPATAHGEEFAALFTHTPIEAGTTADFVSAVWRKLCVNCAGAVFSVTEKPAGIAHREDIAELMSGLVRECIAVGRAEGASIEDAFAETVVAGYRASAKDSINSMLADRLAGRRMEIDARNGVIVRLGAQHGIAVPLNSAMVAMLNALG